MPVTTPQPAPIAAPLTGGPGGARAGINPALILPLHVLAVALLQGSAQAMLFILPVLARKRFDASPFEVLLVTMAPLVLAILSIFWQVALRRGTIRNYLLIYWCVAMLPLGLIAAAQSYWHLLVLHLIGSVASGAWASVNGDLLKRLYPSNRHGNAFAWVSSGSMVAAAGMSLGIGYWLSINPDAFRWYMPALALLQLAGALLLAWLAAAAGAERPGVRGTEPWSPAHAFEPVLHMREVLRADRVFFRYEAAFMTYGIGWMICWALLPLIVTDKLKLDYNEIGSSTAFTYQLATVLAIVPAGWLNDRIGPMRISALAFAIYTLYPVGLLLAANTLHLSFASVVFGIATAGVNMGWLLGPVSLAPTPDKVPQYVAIHATLVGLRGTIFQGLGVVLYELTGSFALSLVIAALGFVWASVQMVSLWRSVEARRRAERAGDPTEFRGTETPE